ncbi:MAG: hypothetical protein Q8S43_01290 [Actinomycetota bacterium]|nr:hypothetical protein [Actinomycetota bacterium]MDZ4234138.1 hypothetical protein [Dietzia sp.]
MNSDDTAYRVFSRTCIRVFKVLFFGLLMLDVGDSVIHEWTAGSTMSLVVLVVMLPLARAIVARPSSFESGEIVFAGLFRKLALNPDRIAYVLLVSRGSKGTTHPVAVALKGPGGLLRRWVLTSDTTDGGLFAMLESTGVSMQFLASDGTGTSE